MNIEITANQYEHMVLASNGEAVTTSLRVAEYFGKRHKDVLRKIKQMKCSPEFNERNFAPVEYIDSKGQRRPMYEMTKDGFIFLAFGFTGEKADAIKEAYINAFNWMAERLRSYDHMRNELIAMYKAGQQSASFYGRGLCGWKHEKRFLEGQICHLETAGQLAIPFEAAERGLS